MYGRYEPAQHPMTGASTLRGCEPRKLESSLLVSRPARATNKRTLHVQWGHAITPSGSGSGPGCEKLSADWCGGVGDGPPHCLRAGLSGAAIRANGED